MSEKRKDNRGRILRTGESQRPNLTYQYRYTDAAKVVHYVYAPTLEALRNKEQEIRRDLNDGIDYNAGNMTVIDLVRRSMEIRKRKLGTNTLRAYTTAVKRLERSSFGQRQIKTVKISDAKLFFLQLSILHNVSCCFLNLIELLDNLIHRISPPFSLPL